MPKSTLALDIYIQFYVSCAVSASSCTCLFTRSFRLPFRYVSVSLVHTSCRVYVYVCLPCLCFFTYACVLLLLLRLRWFTSTFVYFRLLHARSCVRLFTFTLTRTRTLVLRILVQSFRFTFDVACLCATYIIYGSRVL